MNPYKRALESGYGLEILSSSRVDGGMIFCTVQVVKGMGENRLFFKLPVCLPEGDSFNAGALACADFALKLFEDSEAVDHPEEQAPPKKRGRGRPAKNSVEGALKPVASEDSAEPEPEDKPSPQPEQEAKPEAKPEEKPEPASKPAKPSKPKVVCFQRHDPALGQPLLNMAHETIPGWKDKDELKKRYIEARDAMIGKPLFDDCGDVIEAFAAEFKARLLGEHDDDGDLLL